MAKLAVFDFDGTLMDGETIDFFAKEAKVEDVVSQITQKAMSGELDFYEALKQRVALLKGLKESKILEISQSLPYMNGAKELIDELKNRGYCVICFSGGFSHATAIARERLGFSADFSNKLHIKDGILSGEVGGEMMFGNSKGVMIEKIQALLNIDKNNTIAIGDGANDASMFPFADKKVAFCAKPYLKERANIIIDKKDLRDILDHINL